VAQFLYSRPDRFDIISGAGTFGHSLNPCRGDWVRASLHCRPVVAAQAQWQRDKDAVGLCVSVSIVRCEV